MSGDMAFLLQAICVGSLIPFLYDGLRILRRVIPHRNWVVSVEDLLFWLLCTWYVFLWMYRVSNGGMRWFAIVGALMGMCVYKRLISGFWVEGVSRLLRFLLDICGKVLSVLLRPMVYCMKKTGIAYGKVSQKRRKVIGNLKIWLKSFLKALKIRVCKK